MRSKQLAPKGRPPSARRLIALRSGAFGETTSYVWYGQIQLLVDSPLLVLSNLRKALCVGPVLKSCN